MPKNDELQKHTLNLRKGDWEELALALPEVPTSTIIRMIVSRFVDQIKQEGASITSVEIKL